MAYSGAEDQLTDLVHFGRRDYDEPCGTCNANYGQPCLIIGPVATGAWAA